MIFTQHACERYRQFHMLDQPAATDEDARRILERSAATAIHINARTHRGDPIWRIEELGVELVARPSNGTTVCVTILPPARFRGLTPLQAEAVDASMRAAAERNDAIECERKLLKAKAPTSGSKPVDVDRERERLRRLETLNESAKLAQAEQLTLASVLKTMRTQLTQDRTLGNAKSALRIALRYLRRADVVEVMDQIRAIDPGLVSDEFIGCGES